MKWATLLKEFKEKVGFSQAPSASSSASDSNNNVNNASPSSRDYALFPSGDKHELELDFKRYWEEFSSSNSEKEKKKALNWTVEIFHRLVKQHSNVAQLIPTLVQTHIFSFVLGRAFVTDIEKLKLSSKTRALEVERVLNFFSETAKDGIKPGANLLHAVEVLVSAPIDKQSFLDSGILCCLIYVLNALLTPDGGSHRQKPDNNEELLPADQNHDGETNSVPRREVEGSVVNILKALATHPSAAQSLKEDNSFELLFQMVANGSSVGFSPYKEGSVPLPASQLHRHAMQIKVLLMAVKDFNPDCGNPAYTMGIVDLLLECIVLSHRPGKMFLPVEAGATRLREDIHNAHGYQFVVQFALILSKNQGGQTLYSESFSEKDSTSDSLHAVREVEIRNSKERGNNSPKILSSTLSRLLHVIVDFAQTGPSDVSRSSELKASKIYHTESGGEGRSLTPSSYQITDEIWEKDIGKVKDLEAVQMLQDILIKAESRELQAEVLNILFKIFSSHLENYKLCQQLRTVPLLILNMAGLPPSLQEIILKILEYVVTVVNVIPVQELLSLCCLLQQPITSDLKHTILSFFVKLLSFHQQYKKILREVGVLELLLDDLKQHKFLGPEPLDEELNQPVSFKKHLGSNDAILSSPKLLESGPGKFPIFEVEGTVAVAWDCLVFLLKKDEASQVYFRSANGVTVILPFLTSDTHRSGVLRVLSCLIIDDVNQAHSEELGALIEVLKSGMVTSTSGSQYMLQDDAKCDAFGALWRIVGVNDSAQRVFGEATGFSLLLTTLHYFQRDSEQKNQSSISVYANVFTYLLRAMTAGVCDNAVNRKKLHAIISSQTFNDLLSDSGLICVEYERQVIQLFLELALEIMLPPSMKLEAAKLPNKTENESASFLLMTPSGSFVPDKERVYNASAVRVLMRALLLFTPKVQLELTNLIGKLACASSFNQENLTSIGCVELLLETIYPFLSSSSPLVSHALKIVEVLGAYR
ncbi:Beige/BEACH domain [Forsythia ovata]|uniref:Beige/BEACH domain n=1 Tax=Forsythia ovata TaxID=205694 RepID=A0ABD1VED0_9LAMI